MLLFFLCPNNKPVIPDTNKVNNSTVITVKNKKDFRAHNDYINSDDFISFIKSINRDIDIMLEAKAKDDALFRLIRELKYKTNYTFIDETTIKKDL